LACAIADAGDRKAPRVEEADGEEAGNSQPATMIPDTNTTDKRPNNTFFITNYLLSRV
jgi:hypothetical protein